MKTIGKYEIRGLLGRGGMAKVYRVRIPVVEKIVALKYMAAHPITEKLMGISAMKEGFAREARTMAGLRHPNIVSILDYDIHNNRPFYTMEYHFHNLGEMIGETYVAEDPTRMLMPDRALDYAIRTLKGLCRLHDAGIIHRDIKPFNLLLTEREEVKITDFGLSRVRGEAWKTPSQLKVGSPYYAAPEQEKDPDKADEKADIYSTGVMLFRMITGQLPCGGDNGHGNNDHNPSYAQLLPEPLNKNSQWDEVFAKSLSPDPEKRFQSASKMLFALYRCLEAWEAEKAGYCEFIADTHHVTPQNVKREPRSTPKKVRKKDAKDVFGLDMLMRPKHYRKHHFENPEKGIITDGRGRVWEQGGSPYPVTKQEADEYICHLNEKQFSGRNTWRLPTVDELINIMNPPDYPGSICTETVFDQKKKRLWSGDKASYVSFWYVSLDMGFVGEMDHAGQCFVRAVSGQKG